MIIAHHIVRGGEPSVSAQGPIAAVIVLLSALMVSTVRYRTFKKLRLSPRAALVFMLIVASGVVIGTQFHPAFILVVFSFAYLIFGLIESAFLVRNHLVARKVGGGAMAAAVLEEEDESEEEPSEEL